jgi:glutamine synthetase
MEIMQKVAKKHDMVCLLHEKPFEGVNGSGKHNNWSLSTNTGINLLEPGETPAENAQFLLFLTAVIRAVDEYQALLRVSVASAGNDHRLGAHEAPPAVVSMYLGEELTAILEAVENGTAYDSKEKELLRVGVHILPKFPKDTTDRNSTSPFAFTGNKFEFRMLGSSASISDSNVVLNTAVAQVLREFADILENAENFEETLHELIRKTIRDHKRVIFNGNGYDEAWIREATEVRGLLNLTTTPDALPQLLEEKNVKLFVENRVFSEAEIRARYEIMTENYCKVMNIEVLTMADMVRKQIIPTVSRYVRELAEAARAKRDVLETVDLSMETDLIGRLSSLNARAYTKVQTLDKLTDDLRHMASTDEQAITYRDAIIPAMEDLRRVVDEMETLTAKDQWPVPDYGELLFGIR